MSAGELHDGERPSGGTIHVAMQSHRRLVRETLAFCLSNRSDITVVGHTARCADLVALCASRRTDAVIVDLHGPVHETMAAARQLRDGFPRLALIGLYDDVALPTLDLARRAGFSAVIAGSRGIEALVAMLHEQVGRSGQNGRGEPDRTAPGGLGEQELMAVWLMRSGHGVREVAELTGIQTREMETLRRRVAPRTDVRPAPEPAPSPVVVPRRRPAVPVQRANADPTRTVLVVVRGRPGPTVDRIAQVLLRHRLAFVLDPADPDRDGGTRRSIGIDDPELPASHRGPVALLLVDPTPADWALGESFGAPAVAVHTGQSSGSVAVQALRHGAFAAISAEHVDDDLVPALSLVARGYVAIDAVRARPLLEVLNSRFEGHWPMELSAREHDILLSVARGESVRQTARSLGIAPKTVENTQARLFRKLGVRNRAGALAAARRLGLLDMARQPRTA